MHFILYYNVDDQKESIPPKPSNPELFGNGESVDPDSDESLSNV